MMDELFALSVIVNYNLILLREPEEFYKSMLDELKNNGVTIVAIQNSWKLSFRKLITITVYFFKNFKKFGFDYNSIIGFKSFYWFLRMDLSGFSVHSKIHAQFATQATIISSLITDHFKKEPQYTFTFHAYDIYFNNKWFKFLVKNSNGSYSISEYNMNYVKSKYKISEKVELSRLGVFKPDFVERTEIKQNHKFTIGLLSWFVEKKGIIYLLKAMNKLKQLSDFSFELVIAGDGPLKDNYEKYIYENDLQKNIKFIGKIKKDQKDAFFKSLDVFVLPSISLENDMDGIPVVLMEAISYGVPIISTNVSGIPEICIDGYNGYLIHEKNSDEIYDAILKIKSNPDLRILFSKNAVKLSHEYDIERNTLNKARMMNWI